MRRRCSALYNVIIGQLLHPPDDEQHPGYRCGAVLSSDSVAWWPAAMTGSIIMKSLRATRRRSGCLLRTVVAGAPRSGAERTRHPVLRSTRDPLDTVDMGILQVLRRKLRLASAQRRAHPVRSADFEKTIL